MTLALPINIILSAIVFIAIVGFLAAAIRPARRVPTNAPASGRASTSNRPAVALAAAPARGLS
jgi:hypothetical protein